MISQGDLGHAPSRSGVRVRASVSGQAFVGEWPGHSNEPRQAVERAPRWLSCIDSYLSRPLPSVLELAAADIRAMLEDLGIHAPDFSGTYTTGRGNIYECFNLPKRETLILVSGYSVALPNYKGGLVKSFTPSRPTGCPYALYNKPHFATPFRERVRALARGKSNDR